MLIRRALTEIQRFEKVKINKENVWPSGRCVGQRPDGHTFLCKFGHFQTAVSCLRLGVFTLNLGICKAWSALYDYVDQ